MKVSGKGTKTRQTYGLPEIKSNYFPLSYFFLFFSSSVTKANATGRHKAS